MVKHNIVDCNNIKLTPKSFSGSAGTKFGVIYDNEDWIMKLPRNGKYFHNVNISYTTSPLSEYIGSHIYQILGYDVHETLLGFYKNKIVVLCKNFNADGNKLHEFKNMRNYIDEEVVSDDSESTVLDDVLSVIVECPLILDKEETFERFWDMFVIDALINNNDRNNGNWGFLFDENDIESSRKLAPIYDNGNCFNNKLNDSDIIKRLNNEETMMNVSVYSVNSIFMTNNGRRINSFNLIKSKEYDGLNNAIIKNVPIICKSFVKICDFIDSIPNKTKTGMSIMSKEYKTFIKETMIKRLEDVLVPVYEDLKVLKEIDKCSKGLIKDNDDGMEMGE